MMTTTKILASAVLVLAVAVLILPDDGVHPPATKKPGGKKP